MAASSASAAKMAKKNGKGAAKAAPRDRKSGSDSSIAAKASQNGTGHSPAPKRVAAVYPATPEGMDGALEELVAVRQALRVMRVELTPDQERIRNIVKKYAERNLKLPQKEQVPAISETNRRIAELRGMLEESFEDTLAVADTRFNGLVASIRKGDADLLASIDDELAKLWTEFRSVLAADEGYMDVTASAYAAVNDLLVSTLERMHEEAARRRAEQLAKSVKQSLADL